MFVFRFEFPEVSATRLASGSLNSTVLCLVLHKTLVFLRVESSLLATPGTHRPWLEATGHVLKLPAIGEVYHWPAGHLFGR